MKDSMYLFMPSESHTQILNEIGRWKAISFRGLYENIGERTAYSPFCRLLKRLEQEDFIKSFIGHGRRKYAILTDKGAMFSQYASEYSEGYQELKHDIIVSGVLRSLLKFKNFKSGSVVHEHFDAIPDGVIYAVKKDRSYSLAVEVELHQKSQLRLIQKFAKYKQSNTFNYVIYITNKRSIFDSYEHLLKNMNESVRDKIILLLDENLSEYRFDYLESELSFRGKRKTFVEIFG